MLESVIRNDHLINYCIDFNILKKKKEKKERKSDHNWNKKKFRLTSDHQQMAYSSEIT
jgi:hypothetical protein